LHGLGEAAQIRGQEAVGFLGQIDQDGAGLEHRKRAAAVERRMVHYGRNAVVSG